MGTLRFFFLSWAMLLTLPVDEDLLIAFNAIWIVAPGGFRALTSS